MEDSLVKIKAYLEEISTLQNEKQYDLNILKKCLKDADLSDSELEKIEQISHGHYKRSKEYILDENLDGAIMSMERTIEITPFSDEYLNRMSQLYLKRSKREGDKKLDRDLAYNAAKFSYLLNHNNPIAKKILKEIKTKEDKISGKDLQKKVIKLLLIMILISFGVFFIDKKYKLPFFSASIENTEDHWEKPVTLKTTEFKHQEFEIQLNSLQTDIKINIDRSIIEKRNGSYAYTLWGNITNGEKGLKDLGMNISFIDYENETIFNKTINLLNENQKLKARETLQLDQFFYIHYLPPQIDKITLALENIEYSKMDEIITEIEPISIDWISPRPEGVKIKFYMEETESFNNYSQSYINAKIELRNLGFIDLKNLEINLKWKNKYDETLYFQRKTLINDMNPPLKKGDHRSFYIFSELPLHILDQSSDFTISIERIN